ncbi:ExbD/TolR family protein [Pseudoduganella sp. GCM10020061]|uniref:ExbD/TolR family protein n=1 Tax=Pseudoduganella sp. GCM10020061 TaxID=3317345 RepID=UPI003643FE57
MSFGAFNPSRQHQMMSDINVTPMVDVMLVLLVIFILTAPMFTHAIKLELPREQAAAAHAAPDTVSISLDAAGKIYWNDRLVDDAAFDAMLSAAAFDGAQPEIQLRADRATRYESVAKVMAAAQAHGLTRLGFVTDPAKKEQ